MPPHRPNRTPKAALILLAAIMLTLLVATPVPVVRGDRLPARDNGDASKSVTWVLNSTNGLTLNGLELSNGNLSLPWIAQNLTWQDPAAFAANGTLDPNLTIASDGISLRWDPTNYLADGDFATEAPWVFESSASGNVSAAWSSSGLNAVFRHDSAGTSSLWNSLDSTSGWLGVSPPAGAGIWTNTTAQLEGAAMLGLNVTLAAVPDAWAGVLRMAPVNWSDQDRMLVWILPLSVDSPLSFNVTAFVGGTFKTTTARPLVAGWQQVEVDLSELGPVRDVLASLTLRVNGEDVPSTVVYFDDLRIGNAKRFEETARIRQVIVKPDATSTAPGNAVLRFNWSLPNGTGIVRAMGTVSVSGPSGTLQTSFPGLPGSGWRTFLADFSGTTGLPGSYDVGIGFQIELSNASASSVEALLDDVSLLFPNRRNGTYVSRAVPLGASSQFLRVIWSFDASGPTEIRASLRSGNDTSPGNSSWSSWVTWSASGAYSPTLPGAAFIQVRIDLMTTNSSAGPTLRAMTLETRHRSPGPGSAVSDLFRIPPDEVGAFMHWRTLTAVSRSAAGTSIGFSVGNGSSWRSVPADGSLSGITYTTIQWSVTLATTDTLVSPSLERLELVYEYLGPVVEVELQSTDSLLVSTGSSISFTARALDAGRHVISSSASRFDWSTSDRGGVVSGLGVYTAGTIGEHTVTARYVGTNRSATIEVTVVATDLFTGTILPFLPYGLGVLLVTALGYAGYEFAIRRMFAIDDVFLISNKDGRLLMHNTRRLRADRDEDILSGMLTAILSFLRASDPEENGELRRFEIGGKTTLLEPGAHAYLVAVYSGRVPRWAGKDLRRFMSSLEVRFGDAFARWSGDPEDLQGLKEFTGHFVSRVRYRPRRRAPGRAA